MRLVTTLIKPCPLHHTYPFHVPAELQSAGYFVESAEVHGNYYGTSKAAVEKVINGGKLCILDIDVQVRA